MLLPPFKKSFNIPPELINSCNLLGCKIIMISCHKIFDAGNLIANNPNGVFGLIYSGGAKKNHGMQGLTVNFIVSDIFLLHFYLHRHCRLKYTDFQADHPGAKVLKNFGKNIEPYNSVYEKTAQN